LQEEVHFPDDYDVMEVSGEENRVGQMGGRPRLRHEDLRNVDNSGGMNRQRTGYFGMEELVE